MISSVTDFGKFPFTPGQSNDHFKKVAEQFRDDCYQRVQFSRPLIYLLWADADLVTYFDNSLENFAGIIREFRSYTREKNLGDPYIVVMAGDPEHSAKIARATGCDAISNYISSFAAPQRMPFARLAPQVERFWIKLANTKLASIPIAMVGWDTRPRQEQPVPWEHQDPIANSDLQHFYAKATPDEFARHAQHAIDFVRANQANCPANTILIYSWDECDEGGCILPMIGDPSG